MVQNVLLLTAASLAMRAVSMLFQVYLSGRIGAAGLGLLQLIMTVHAFAITVGTSGIRVAAMYLTAEEYGHRRLSGVRAAMVRCLGCGFGLSLLVGSSMVFGARYLSLVWVKDLRAVPSLQLLGATMPITCISSVLGGYFTACGKIRRLVAVELADRIATVAATAWLLNHGSPGDVSYACVSIVGGGALAGAGAVCVLLFFFFRDLHRYPKESEPTGMGKRLLSFCIPVALNDYLRSGLGTLEQFLIPLGLSRYGGSRTQALADYGTIQGMVFPVMMFLSTILFSLADLLVPRLARYKATGSTKRLQDTTARCLQASCLFSAAVAGLLFVLAESLCLLLYDSRSAGQYLRIFTPLLPVLYLDCIVDGMHKGLGQQIYCVRINTLTNFLDVVGLFLLLPRYGLGGYFFTYALTHVINFFLSLHKLMKVTDMVPDIGFLLRNGCCILLCTLFVFKFASPSVSWSGVILSTGIYLAIFSLLFVLIRKKAT